MFRQTIVGLGLSIEEGTDNVPHDGRYYVLERGAAGRSFHTLREANRRYTTRKAELLTATAGPSERGAA